MSTALGLLAVGCTAGGSGGGEHAGTGGDAASATGGAPGSDGLGGAAGSGTGGAAAVGLPCTGKPGVNRGKTVQTLMVDGVARTFVLYVPESLDPNQPAPIVVVPHGYTMSAEEMFALTGYDKVADRDGVVIAYPNGQVGNPWAVGTGTCGNGAFVAASGDDQPFMNALVDFIEADRCIDRAHVFITGFSMGGYFAHHSACMNPLFRAAGPHSGGTHDLSGCTAGHKPMIIFHFESDSLIAYSCATEARDKWVAHNGCTLELPDAQPVEGGTCEYYRGCPADGQVVLCSFAEPEGGGGESMTGHAWSGGVMGSSDYVIPQTESASELGWAFFKKYAW